jgi:hypothetical protein
VELELLSLGTEFPPNEPWLFSLTDPRLQFPEKPRLLSRATCGAMAEINCGASALNQCGASASVFHFTISIARTTPSFALGLSPYKSNGIIASGGHLLLPSTAEPLLPSRAETPMLPKPWLLIPLEPQRVSKRSIRYHRQRSTGSV